MSSVSQWEVLPLVGPFLASNQSKYKGNCQNFIPYFILAITFHPMHIFVKLQSQVQGLGVDFVFPLSQQEQEQEEPNHNIP